MRRGQPPNCGRVIRRAECNRVLWHRKTRTPSKWELPPCCATMLVLSQPRSKPLGGWAAERRAPRANAKVIEQLIDFLAKAFQWSPRAQRRRCLIGRNGYFCIFSHDTSSKVSLKHKLVSPRIVAEPPALPQANVCRTYHLHKPPLSPVASYRGVTSQSSGPDAGPIRSVSFFWSPRPSVVSIGAGQSTLYVVIRAIHAPRGWPPA
jgi:hypothetical protein